MPSADVTTDRNLATLISDGEVRSFAHIGAGSIIVTNDGENVAVISSDVPRMDPEKPSQQVGEYLLVPGNTIRLPPGFKRFYHKSGKARTVLVVAVG